MNIITVEERLERIESILVRLVDQQTIREWHSVEQFAEIIGKSTFTVREYARLGRIHAKKKKSGRGAYESWAISHVELTRYQRDGLLPLMPGRNQ